MRNSRLIFLLDGAGALGSALLMSALVAPHPEWFGVSTGLAYALVIPALVLAGYSGGCALGAPPIWRPHLKRIAFANICYCGIIGGVMIARRGELLTFGWVYLAVETMIILALAAVELRIVAAEPVG